MAKASRDANQTRRLLALAVIYAGGRQSAAGKLGRVGLQVIRDRVLRFNAVGPVGLRDHKALGAASRLNKAHRRARISVASRCASLRTDLEDADQIAGKLLEEAARRH